MRTLNKNKQTIYYSNQIGVNKVYERDEFGNIKYIIVDGKQVYIESGETETVYSTPAVLKGNISFSGGESQAVEFGVDVSAYDAVIVVSKGEVNLSETSLIWFESEVGYKDIAHTIVDPYSADYRVTKPIPSLNEKRYLLKKVVNDENL